MVETHTTKSAQPASTAVFTRKPSAADGGTSAQIEVRIETSFEGSGQFGESWDQAVSRLGGSIYMTYGWLKTWWDFYGVGKRLRLFTFRKGDEVIGLLPMYLETFGIGPLKATVARLVGANIPPKTFNPPIDPAFALQVVVGVLKRLFVEEGCDLLSLGPVSAIWPAAAVFQAAFAQCRELASAAAYQTRDVQTWFQLPATFEEYLGSLSGSERKQRLKRIRHLEKSYRISSDIVSEPALVEKEFSAFVSLHARQWKAVGRAGHFGAWPDGEAYNRALVKAQAPRVRFFRMLADGQVVSSRYAFVLGNTIYSELPAREIGEPWDKLGIGGISLIKFVESAIQSGFSAIDSGLGTYEHKAQLGGEEIPVGIWRVRARGLKALKARVLCAVAKIVLFACHKVWYRRLLPRMPRLFKRTQHPWWLRFDL